MDFYGGVLSKESVEVKTAEALMVVTQGLIIWSQNEVVCNGLLLGCFQKRVFEVNTAEALMVVTQGLIWSLPCKIIQDVHEKSFNVAQARISFPHSLSFVENPKHPRMSSSGRVSINQK